MDKVVHFEIPADDVARAKSFYSTAFGWRLQDMEGYDYTVAMTTPVDEQQMPTEPGAINGGMMKRDADRPAPVLTIAVDSRDIAMKEAEAAGGTMVTPKREMPGIGTSAYFKDTEERDRSVGERRLTGTRFRDRPTRPVARAPRLGSPDPSWPGTCRTRARSMPSASRAWASPSRWRWTLAQRISRGRPAPRPRGRRSG
jgi:predicted enzyme related to lactoylglutathione lyase